ncbi:MAG: O-antigen ligase family protein, partial [Myxococcota bacterium]
LLVTTGAIGTGLTNGDTITYGPRVLPGIGLYEAMHVLQYDLLTMFLPFYVGYLCYRSASDLVELLGALVIASLAYVPLMLVESWLSPQTHRILYGVSPVLDFSQAWRWGGWRPNVFFNHGLALAVFVATSLLAAVPFARHRWRIHRLNHGRWVFGVLSGALLLSRSLGGWIYGAGGALLAWFGSPRLVFRAATLLAALVLVYPLLRAWELFPDETLVRASASLANEERAASLEFRFENEKALMEKVAQRPLFGWGGFGRAALYESWSGQELSVRDGAWIILLGERGLFGFAVAFGLLTIPIGLAARRLRRWPDGPTRRLAATLALIVAVMTVDLLPNGLFNYLPFFLAGSLAGVVAGLMARSAAIARVRSRAGVATRRLSPTRAGPVPAS